MHGLMDRVMSTTVVGQHSCVKRLVMCFMKKNEDKISRSIKSSAYISGVIIPSLKKWKCLIHMAGRQKLPARNIDNSNIQTTQMFLYLLNISLHIIMFCVSLVPLTPLSHKVLNLNIAVSQFTGFFNTVIPQMARVCCNIYVYFKTSVVLCISVDKIHFMYKSLFSLISIIKYILYTIYLANIDIL
jgi:hypothetical protein